MFRLFFYPVAESYPLVVVLALLLTGLLALGPRRGTALRRRIALALLRAGVIALAVLALLRPTLVYTETRKEKATLVVLADQTRSMSVRDALGGKSRWDALRNALSEAAPALGELSRDFELKAYTFDAETHPVESEGGKIKLPSTPEGTETAIGAALEDVLREQAGKRLLGVILLSDGAQRALAPRDLPPQIAAARLKHQGDPLFTVGFGQSRGLGEAQDVALKELVANPTVFVKNELSVTGQVRIDGYVNREIPVRLLFEKAPGKMEVVAQQNVKSTADGQLLPVKFTYVPETTGEFKLTLEAVPQPGELVVTNNQLSTFVRVLKGGLSVLYVEGAVRVEQKFLRRALDASRDIKVDFVRLDPRQPEIRPSDMAQRFKPGKYEVYILGDVDSTAFEESELKDLAAAVDKGAGLIMLGGFHSFGPGGYGGTPLADVLPVAMDRFERQKLDEPVRGDLHLAGPLAMQPTTLGLRHFALTLAGDAAGNAALWAKLPPLEGANQFLKLSRGAVPLATADGNDNKPLLVSHSFGNGRVMAFAGDSTWHWQLQGFESAHKRFWRQIVLWLARKDAAMEGSVWIKLEKRCFAPTEAVEFSVGAQSANGEAVKDAEFKVEVLPPAGRRSGVPVLRQDEQSSGTFREAREKGDYLIEVTATRHGQSLGTARARFLVSPQDLELDNASADAETMESLATMTGGRTVAPEQLSELIRQLAAQTQNFEVQQETKKTFWDKWPFFLLLVCLLSTEWYFRKRWGLV
ncbi:MAG: hypothetical protein ABSG68_00920 [Thermoguttaceae bacterium]|jgi:hypothetical protein